MNQKGTAQLVIVLLLLLAIGLGLYLVQKRTNINPHAQNAQTLLRRTPGPSGTPFPPPPSPTSLPIGTPNSFVIYPLLAWCNGGASSFTVKFDRAPYATKYDFYRHARYPNGLAYEPGFKKVGTLTQAASGQTLTYNEAIPSIGLEYTYYIFAQNETTGQAGYSWASVDNLGQWYPKYVLAKNCT